MVKAPGFSFSSMESVASSSSVAHQEPSNYDEYSMQQSLLFGDSLKDLKSLRKQLYSAAEYFEQCYHKDDQKQIVLETLKDYAIKALVNTVDHLGSVTYKVNTFLDDKIGEVHGTELQFSCIEQRIRTCREFINRSGFCQQSLLMRTPKHHKRYTFPGKYGGETTNTTGHTIPTYQTCSPYAEGDLHQFYKGGLATAWEMPSSMMARRGHSARPSPQSSPRPRAFPFNITRISSSKERDKRAVSPNYFPLIRSGSVASRSTSPNSSKAKLRTSSEPRSASLFTRTERERAKDIEQQTSQSKRLFKALISMRKPKKDVTLYRYLDEN
ncbi:protein ABIL2 isoform X5 [Vitis vinifera]|uniref:protein ABIL2 isoform X5 n=1 Tax=Vitis vinifera TaxID=29760 RepID=UPI00053F7577|nr:protein ABIL2 isoform X5 [Vitis vinifera]|eukprot:XP_010659662.1 PREDICTED: protein ABIL2 isoform X7 [Vitis vinifera]